MESVQIRPFLNYLSPLCQNDSSSKTIHIRFFLGFTKQVCFYANQTNYHMKGFAERLPLKQRPIIKNVQILVIMLKILNVYGY